MSNVTIEFENGVYEGSDPYNLDTFISGNYKGENIFLVYRDAIWGRGSKPVFELWGVPEGVDYVLNGASNWGETIDDLVKKIDSGKKTA